MDAEDIAYGEGHEAYYRGYTLKDNPYKRYSNEWEEWRQGWIDEKEDNPYWHEIKRY